MAALSWGALAASSLVLGISFASGQGVGVSLLLAIFVSNFPEALGSSEEMRRSGRRPSAILALWLAVAAICTVAAVAGDGLLGFALAAGLSNL